MEYLMYFLSQLGEKVTDHWSWKTRSELSGITLEVWCEGESVCVTATDVREYAWWAWVW
jgi:hypothetical protein